jgi:ribosomal protein L40E
MKDNSNKRICQTCGKKNPLSADFCIECSKKLPKFILPFANNISPEDYTSKSENEKPLPFADINMKPVDVKDSSVNDIKKQDVNSNRQICQTCGNKNLFNAKFCITCGTELPKFTKTFADDNSPKNNKIMNNVTDSEKTIKISDEINENDPSSEGNSEINPLNAIKKANELLQIGAITEEEFEIIKNKYIEKI